MTESRVEDIILIQSRRGRLPTTEDILHALAKVVTSISYLCMIMYVLIQSCRLTFMFAQFHESIYSNKQPNLVGVGVGCGKWERAGFNLES